MGLLLVAVVSVFFAVPCGAVTPYDAYNLYYCPAGECAGRAERPAGFVGPAAAYVECSPSGSAPEVYNPVLERGVAPFTAEADAALADAQSIPPRLGAAELAPCCVARDCPNEAALTAVSPAPAPSPRAPAPACCLAMTASCLACGAGVAKEAYCVANPQTVGCDEVACCRALTAECVACAERKTEAEVCQERPGLVGCVPLMDTLT